MNPQGAPAEEANANIENNENDGSPQLSLESTLQRPLPLFPLPAESEQRFLDWFPQAQMNLPQQGPSTGAPLHESSNVALVSNNSPSSSLIGTPQGFPNRLSNDVGLSLTLGSLGHEGAIRSPAVDPSNNVAPGHEVQGQGMHEGTSANATLLPSKRKSTKHASREFKEGESSNMGEKASLAKRRATESRVSANNNVNPSPSLLDLMQQPFSETAHTESHASANNSVYSSPSSLDLMQQPFSESSTESIEGYHHHNVIPQNGATLTPPQPHSRVQSIVDELRNGRPLMFEYHIYAEFVLEYSLVLHALEHAGISNLFGVSRQHTGLRVEVIMQHIKRENFVSTNKKEPKDEEKCAICLEDYEDGDKIGKLDLCVHKYHVQCIKQWLMHKNECPICKQIALTMNNVENEVGG